ncbi:hypothetical protein PsorP6_016090 [Peronosclerospora sorghi]|uniref:Uncharacterized protein n=1 Tax=Peronosclerospora sorghi TaxID=230839 RepID=A0ACC0WNF3_9STRA|nr:hypothetical protein PsorP6_016090 [Peronosclerospora sorghi]
MSVARDLPRDVATVLTTPLLADSVDQHVQLEQADRTMISTIAFPLMSLEKLAARKILDNAHFTMKHWMETAATGRFYSTATAASVTLTQAVFTIIRQLRYFDLPRRWHPTFS